VLACTTSYVSFKIIRLLVQVGDGDTSGKDGVVEAFGDEECSSLRGKVLYGKIICG